MDTAATQPTTAGLLAVIAALSDWRCRAVLEYLAGFAPEVLGAALDDLDRDETAGV